MTEENRKIIKELSEILVSFRCCLDNIEKNKGHWQPNDDWIDEVHHPTQEDVNAITGILEIIERLGKQAVEQHDTIMNYRDEVQHLRGQLTAVSYKRWMG